jgi:hypothetical protein
LQQFARPRLGIGQRHACGDRAIGDDAANRMARIERRKRVLKDHLHVAPHRAELALGEARNVLAVEQHLATVDAGQAQQAFADGRLARARFAHDTQRLTAFDAERHVIHGVRHALLRKQPATET